MPWCSTRTAGCSREVAGSPRLLQHEPVERDEVLAGVGLVVLALLDPAVDLQRELRRRRGQAQVAIDADPAEPRVAAGLERAGELGRHVHRIGPDLDRVL